MRETRAGDELTNDERHLLALLRHGPQSVKGLAEAIGISAEQTKDILARLNRKVGIVTLYRYDTLCYGLAE